MENRDQLTFTWEMHGSRLHVLGSDLLGLTGLAGGEPRTQEFAGIKGLMVAMLEDGIRMYLRGNVQLRTEAEAWIFSSQRRQPFSFWVVCETLGLEPRAVRAATQRLRNLGPYSSPIRKSRIYFFFLGSTVDGGA